MHAGLGVQYPLFLTGFNNTWTYSTYFSKILKYQSSWKFFHWVPSCYMRTDKKTGRHDWIEWSVFAILRTRIKIMSHDMIMPQLWRGLCGKAVGQQGHLDWNYSRCRSK